MDEERATLLMKLAFMPAIRGKLAGVQTQDRAVALVSSVARRLQDEFVSRVLRPLDSSVLPPLDDRALRPPRVVVKSLDWQWDETRQRTIALSHKALPGEHRSAAPTAVQVMMQRGHLRSFVEGPEGDMCMEESEPIFCRGIILEEQKADDIIAGLLRGMPLKIDDVGSLREASSHCQFLLLTFCMDRAANNFATLSWFWKCLQVPNAPLNIFPCAEPCAAHGAALVKTRASNAEGHGIVQSSHTLATFLRNGRNLAWLRESIIELVRNHLVIRRQRPPASCGMTADRLADLLFAGPDKEFLYRVEADGSRKRGRLLQLLDALCSSIDLDGGDPGSLVHYCFVEDASSERPYGSPCCRDHDEAVDKVAVPLLNWVAKPWDVQVTSRWTYVLSALRKLLVSCMAKRLFPTALMNMKASMGVDDSMEASLAKLILADKEDYAARSKMRLIRICKCFGEPAVVWKIAVLISVHAEVDVILHAILGYAQGKKATLSSLVHDYDSPIALCQSKLLACAEEWRPTSNFWRLFGVVGGDFTSSSHRAFARQHLLLASSGLLDYFELRLQHPPYSLLKLLHEYTGDDRRRELAESFFAVPEHCRGLFSTRLRTSFPNVEALLRSGIHLLRAWGNYTWTGIDFVERSHGQMRTDLRSSSNARNFTVSANRIHCQQVYAEQEFRSKKDKDASPDATGASPDALGAAPDEMGGSLVASGASPGAKGASPDAVVGKSAIPRGGARMAWQNQRIASQKSIIAPHRSLTKTEMQQLRQDCRDQWVNEMSAEEKRPWQDIYLARRTQALVSGTRAPLPGPAQGACLWRCVPCSDQQSVFPPHQLMHEHAVLKVPSIDQQRNDSALRVTRPVEARAASSDPHPLFGCFAHKKNVCRATLSADLSARVEAYTKMLSLWADKLTVKGVRSCQHLLLIRHRAPTPDDAVPGKELDTIVLLVDGRRRPKMQFFCRCLISEDADQDFYAPTPVEFPFIVSLARRPGRLSQTLFAPHIVTSDELCLDFCGLGDEWTMHPLLSEEVADADSLMVVRVVGSGDALTQERPVRAPQVKHVELPMEMFEDPFQYGDSCADRTVGAIGSADAIDPGASPGHVMDEMVLGAPVSEFSMEDLFGPDDIDDGADEIGDPLLVDDVQQAAACALGLFDDDELNEFIKSPIATDAVGELEEGGAFDMDALVAVEASGVVGMVEPVPPEITIDHLVETAQIDENGYVTSPVPPWSDYAHIGRRTTWPSTLPMDQRSVGMQCYLHPKCRSPARRRKHISDRVLLHWLFSGQDEVGATAGRSRELAARHQADWPAIVDALKAAEAGAAASVGLVASSGAASGSCG